MDRPNSKKRLPELLYIVGCEGKNQERLYFERIKTLINKEPSRKMNINFIYAEPYGGAPLCVVQRTKDKSIGKVNKLSVFDFDGKTIKYEEAIDLGTENKIQLGYSNYSFDLWLILHKLDYYDVVTHQDDYIPKLRQVFMLKDDDNIKKKSVVKIINGQIEIPDIKNAILRAKSIENGIVSRKSLETPKKNLYYSNPDTQMHKILVKLFREVGLKKILE